MDELYFFGSFTATAFFNETPLYSRECPRQHEDTLLAFLLFLIGCLLLTALSFMLTLEKEVKRIEIAPNPHADFLERINFAGEIPSEFVCPIMQCIMYDPVRIRGAHENHVFERTALEKWINEGKNINPLSREPLSWWARLVSADDISKKIQTWLSDVRLRRQVFSVWSQEKIESNENIFLGKKP